MTHHGALLDCTPPSTRQNGRSVPVSSKLTGADDDAWRRPACGDACSRVRVLAADGAYRGWRDVVSHDHTAYERKLEHTARLLTLALAAISVDPVPAPLVAGPLALDYVTGRVLLDVRVIRLSGQERALLGLLAASPGEVIRRHDLAVALWPEPADRDLTAADQCKLRALVRRVRARLGTAAYLVETVPCVGIRLRTSQTEGTPWPG
jgi:DNA-binding winged helix-turn-helix (wHTH) protein